MLATRDKKRKRTGDGEGRRHRLRDPGLRLRSREHAEQGISREMVLQHQRSGLPMDIRQGAFGRGYRAEVHRPEVQSQRRSVHQVPSHEIE